MTSPASCPVSYSYIDHDPRPLALYFTSLLSFLITNNEPIYTVSCLHLHYAWSSQTNEVRDRQPRRKLDHTEHRVLFVKDDATASTSAGSSSRTDRHASFSTFRSRSISHSAHNTHTGSAAPHNLTVQHQRQRERELEHETNQQFLPQCHTVRVLRVRVLFVLDEPGWTGGGDVAPHPVDAEHRVYITCKGFFRFGIGRIGRR